VPKLITLEEWIRLTYGEAVNIGTARRWCRDGRIYPAPQKHGRSYFVCPEARYTDPHAPPRPRLIDRINGTQAA
jgi:hypothetical protein